MIKKGNAAEENKEKDNGHSSPFQVFIYHILSAHFVITRHYAEKSSAFLIKDIRLNGRLMRPFSRPLQLYSANFSVG
ncbi:hypothetical protein OHD26_10780 [Escherichia coli]|nr:hypothetical protein [Escherichia coli]